MIPTVQAIAIRKKSRAPMQEIPQVEITVEAGLVPDFRGKPGKRQVTLLSADAWQTVCQELQADLPWTTRRANLLIAGHTFSAADAGKILHIGEVQLQITIETDPCNRMDEQHAGLTKVLTPDWRAGVCCRVLQGGTLKPGDKVHFAG
jgi:MOSC domain-containing protein YiiM